MDRQTRNALLAGGFGLLLAAAPGCRTPRTEVPPDRGFSGHGMQTDRPQVGFSTEPPSAQPNPMPNGLPGSGQVPGAYGTGAPTFSQNGPQSAPGSAGNDDSTSSNDINQQFTEPRGQMGEPGQPPQPQ